MPAYWLQHKVAVGVVLALIVASATGIGVWSYVGQTRLTVSMTSTVSTTASTTSPIVGMSVTTSLTTTTAPVSQWSGLDFTLPIVGPNGLTGQSLSLSSFRGKVILLEFMEPWCPHCQNMAPTLQDLYTKYQNNPNVVFISVAGPWNGPDGNPASANDAAKFISTYGTGWTYVYDSSGTVMTNEYGVNSTPTFFIISKSGVVFTTFQGEQAENAIAAAIDNASNAS